MLCVLPAFLFFLSLPYTFHSTNSTMVVLLLKIEQHLKYTIVYGNYPDSKNSSLVLNINTDRVLEVPAVEVSVDGRDVGNVYVV